MTRRVRAAKLSPDLRQPAVLLSPRGTHASPSTAPLAEAPIPGIGNEREELVLLLDVRQLAVRRRELGHCWVSVERLLATCSYARQAVDTLAQVWRGAADGFANKMRGLSESIEAYGGISTSANVHEELLQTCCSGSPTDAVHAFLSRQTSPQQLTRLEKTLGQAFEYVNLVVCTRLQLAGQHILMALQELIACARWQQKFEVIGLEEGPLIELVRHAQDFVRLTELLLLDCS